MEAPVRLRADHRPAPPEVAALLLLLLAAGTYALFAVLVGTRAFGPMSLS